MPGYSPTTTYYCDGIFDDCIDWFKKPKDNIMFEPQLK